MLIDSETLANTCVAIDQRRRTLKFPPANEPIGRVTAIHNFGAGDIIEIAPAQGATMLLPFTNAVVPSVDLARGRVVIELPDEIDGDTPQDTDRFAP